MSDRAPSERLRQGFVLLAGAVVFVLVVGTEPDHFFRVPLGLGLVYLVAAIVGGREGGYWATAVVLVGWGAVVLYAQESRPENIDISGLYLLGAGAGATVGALLSRAGFAVDAVGAAGTIAAAGLILAFSGRWDALTDARYYALIVGVVGLGNVIAGAVGSRSHA